MPYTPPTFASPLNASAYQAATSDVVDYLRTGIAFPGQVARSDLAPQDVTLKGAWGHAWRGVSGCGEYRTAPATLHAHVWEYEPIAGYTVRLQTDRSGVLEVHWQIYCEVGPDVTLTNSKPSTTSDRELRVALSVNGSRIPTTTGDVGQHVYGWAAAGDPDGAERPYEISGGGWIGGTYRLAVGVGVHNVALVAKSQVDRVLVSSGTVLATVIYGA